ncbi:hypothetical protein AP058_00049 [Flavobacterium sp. TAB 87]|nr:hypothetical protein AP058_00049 [Flavobacterium sp. TAB 87]
MELQIFFLVSFQTTDLSEYLLIKNSCEDNNYKEIKTESFENTILYYYQSNSFKLMFNSKLKENYTVYAVTLERL